MGLREDNEWFILEAGFKRKIRVSILKEIKKQFCMAIG